MKQFYIITNDKKDEGLQTTREIKEYLISQGEYKDAQRKLRRAANIDTENNQEVLNLLFYTCYKLVKDDICEYNVKEAINIANKIEDFNYPEYKEELENKLKNM